MKQDPLSNPLYWINVLNPNPFNSEEKFILFSVLRKSLNDSDVKHLICDFFDSQTYKFLGENALTSAEQKSVKSLRFFTSKKYQDNPDREYTPACRDITKDFITLSAKEFFINVFGYRGQVLWTDSAKSERVSTARFWQHSAIKLSTGYRAFKAEALIDNIGNAGMLNAVKAAYIDDEGKLIIITKGRLPKMNKKVFRELSTLKIQENYKWIYIYTTRWTADNFKAIKAEQVKERAFEYILSQKFDCFIKGRIRENEIGTRKHKELLLQVLTTAQYEYRTRFYDEYNGNYKIPFNGNEYSVSELKAILETEIEESKAKEKAEEEASKQKDAEFLKKVFAYAKDFNDREAKSSQYETTNNNQYETTNTNTNNQFDKDESEDEYQPEYEEFASFGDELGDVDNDVDSPSTTASVLSAFLNPNPDRMVVAM